MADGTSALANKAVFSLTILTSFSFTWILSNCALPKDQTSYFSKVLLLAKHLSSIKLSAGWWTVITHIPFGCLGLGKLGLQMMRGKTYLRPICIPRCTTNAFEHTICHRFSDHLGLHFVKIHIILEKMAISGTESSTCISYPYAI